MSVHWGDRLYAGATRWPLRFFAEGFGDHAVIQRLSDEEVLDPPRPIEVELSAPRLVGGFAEQLGAFPSPVADELPEAVARAHFLWLRPAHARATVLLFAATGDTTYARRRVLARALAQAGIGSVLLENPYYGRRRPKGQIGAYLRRVSDLLLMGRATIEEGRSLLAWLRARGCEQLGVAGYSMGGHMAAVVGATAPFPVAIAPASAGITVRPIFTEGLLSRQIAWRRLAREAGGVEVARRRLDAALGVVDLDREPAPEWTQGVVLSAARADGYVRPETVHALHRHWSGAELRWHGGGHVSAFLLGRSGHAAAIGDALERMAS